MKDEKELEIIDTHAHLDLEDFDKDRDEVIHRLCEGKFPEIRGKEPELGSFRFHVAALILPGITAESSLKAASLAEENNLFHPGAGIHPNYLLEMKENDWETVKQLAQKPATAAIGETGLDLHWDASPLELQIEYLFRHFLLAKRLRLPVIIHCRDAENEMMDAVRAFRNWETGGRLPEKPGFHPLAEPEAREVVSAPPMNGVIHSYSGGPETAGELIRLGFYLGFTGSVTYTGRKFSPIGEAAKVVPDDRILLETDSPFLIPHPFRGKLDRNEPIMSVWTARRLAELRETNVSEILRLTAQNARRLFRITP